MSSRNKVIKPSPKKHTVKKKKNKNGEILYLRIGHLCYVVLSHHVLKSSWNTYEYHWLPGTSQSEADSYDLPITQKWKFKLLNTLSKYKQTKIVANQSYTNINALYFINHIRDKLILLESPSGAL